MQTNRQIISNFFERISMIMDHYGIKSVKAFACDYLGYNSSEKINRLRDASKNPSYEILVDISNKFEEVDPGWILTGKGGMLINKEVSEKSSVKPDSISEIIDLATQLGMQIKENEQLHRRNMELMAELNNFKNKKEAEVQRVPVQRFKDRTEYLPDIASEP